MNIAVWANNDQWDELTSVPLNAQLTRLQIPFKITGDAQVLLLLQDESTLTVDNFSGPVIINSVSKTLKELNAPANVLRINGWNGFLARNKWEIAGPLNQAVEEISTIFGKQLIPVPDEPGFVSARVIAMIINEAYFALEDQISTKEEIDIAMKLGTNYSYGPFEWGDKIGIGRIYTLLKQLSADDIKYNPARLLKEAAAI